MEGSREIIIFMEVQQLGNKEEQDSPCAIVSRDTWGAENRECWHLSLLLSNFELSWLDLTCSPSVKFIQQ